MTSTGEATRDTSGTQTAVVLAAATVLSFVVLAALDHEGAGWMIFPVLGLATAVIAWRAGGTSPQNMRLRALDHRCVGHPRVPRLGHRGRLDATISIDSAAERPSPAKEQCARRAREPLLPGLLFRFASSVMSDGR